MLCFKGRKEGKKADDFGTESHDEAPLQGGLDPLNPRQTLASHRLKPVDYCQHVDIPILRSYVRKTDFVC
jgi:hypothetical protein